jgi:hypothetical protein
MIRMRPAIIMIMTTNTDAAATITAILHDRLAEIAIFYDWQKPRKALMPDFAVRLLVSVFPVTDGV